MTTQGSQASPVTVPAQSFV